MEVGKQWIGGLPNFFRRKNWGCCNLQEYGFWDPTSLLIGRSTPRNRRLALFSRHRAKLYSSVRPIGYNRDRQGCCRVLRLALRYKLEPVKIFSWRWPVNVLQCRFGRASVNLPWVEYSNENLAHLRDPCCPRGRACNRACTKVNHFQRGAMSGCQI